MDDLGICDRDQGGRLFDNLKTEKSPAHGCLDFKTFHSGMLNMTSGQAKTIDTRQNSVQLSLPPKRSILQPLDAAAFRQSCHQFNLDMKAKNHEHDTWQIVAPAKNTDHFMATRDRFDRTHGHRETCVREDRAKRDRLMQERVANKNNVLTLYEDIKSRSDWKQQQRDSNNILMHQQQKIIYDEVI